MPDPSIADQVRALHAAHPELRPAELARRVGCSREAAGRALKSSGKRGRPWDEEVAAGVELVRLRLPVELHARAREAAKRDRVTMHTALVRAVERGLRAPRSRTK